MNKYEQRTSGILKELGMPATLLGYRYIKDAVNMVIEDETLLRAITKRLYPDIAKMNETTPSRVERAMRHAIETSWLRGDQDLQLKLFGNSVDPDKANPTNSEFIAALAEHISMNGDVDL